MRLALGGGQGTSSEVVGGVTGGAGVSGVIGAAGSPVSTPHTSACSP